MEGRRKRAQCLRGLSLVGLVSQRSVIGGFGVSEVCDWWVWCLRGRLLVGLVPWRSEIGESDVSEGCDWRIY